MLWYSLDVPCLGISNEYMYSQLVFTQRNKKNINTFSSKKAPYLELCIVSVNRQQRPLLN